jgi:hypothetical protein
MTKYSKAVAGHEYAQAQEIFFDDGTVLLQSYRTIVIKIDPEGWLRCTGTYSMTTIKHIGWFMRERGLSYQLAKLMYLEDKEYNIHTGECRNRG